MTRRYRAESLKQVKRMIAQGMYHEAENILLAKRGQLLAVLEDPNCDDDEKIELLLTLTNSLLAECYSSSGRVAMAEEWFEHSFKFCRESHDPMVRLRLHRMYAMHLRRVGRYDEASAEIDAVIRKMGTRKFALASMIPEDRIRVELAFSRSCKAAILQDQFPGSSQAAKQACKAKSILRKGTKRRYELQNLMLCIGFTSPFTSPIDRRRLILRAWFVNERYVHSADIRLRLIHADTIAPTFMLLQRLR